MTDSQKDPRVADAVSTEPAQSSNSGSVKGSAKHMLREFFGFPEFRPGQEAVVEAAARGRDVLAVMPTSGGKSLCYQVPALMAEGLTLVISPLISLMKDQMDSLRAQISAVRRPSGHRRRPSFRAYGRRAPPRRASPAKRGGEDLVYRTREAPLAGGRGDAKASRYLFGRGGRSPLHL